MICANIYVINLEFNPEKGYILRVGGIFLKYLILRQLRFLRSKILRGKHFFRRGVISLESKEEKGSSDYYTPFIKMNLKIAQRTPRLTIYKDILITCKANRIFINLSYFS
jgi:hypothetical protein